MKKLLISSALLLGACKSAAPCSCPHFEEDAGTYSTVSGNTHTLGAFPTAVNDQITDSVTQANPPGLEALKLLDHMNQNLDAMLVAKGINTKNQTCEQPPSVCK